MDSELQAKPRQTPLPMGQLSLILMIQSSDPIASTVIYPFIAQLIRSTGVTKGDEARVGYYAGMIESIFFLSEGRPILLWAPLGLAVAMLGFGLSRTFWLLVFWRAVQGVFNGNIGVARTAMAEITDSTNIADAYMLFPIVWQIGVTLGPAIGGLLSEPASNWPRLFGGVGLFVDYPYFLPCLVPGVYALVVFFSCWFGLKETHPSFRKKTKADDSEDASRTPLLSETDDSVYDATRQSSTESTHPSAPPPVSIFNPNLNIVLANYFFLAFTDMSYVVLIPIFYSTSNSMGGLGFSAKTIGTTLAVYNFGNAFVQITIMKRVLKWLGPRRLYQFAYSMSMVPFVMMMCQQMLVSWYGKVTLGVWVAIVLQFSAASVSNVSYACIQLLHVEAATPGTLGAVNGFSQTAASAIRTVAPTLASSLFALSLQSGVLGGYLVYAVILPVTLVGSGCATRLPSHLS
ncbi:hypothetical protein E1B28_006540 [Marasmius oreades]|uniref:Major facilitator superfamily (MFS) profile domain-containing protein n=1 Tax=Marasmius oreades TaxID=181124 RepID=A0A9P7S6F0_9AGAR|nr:uncharacterized protein E1B28_006540 [Marasmius oreades]KAG7095845.1 hypothetical protein E1B28_006540 [Marasmius oreades]